MCTSLPIACCFKTLFRRSSFTNRVCARVCVCVHVCALLFCFGSPLSDQSPLQKGVLPTFQKRFAIVICAQYFNAEKPKNGESSVFKVKAVLRRTNTAVICFTLVCKGEMFIKGQLAQLLFSEVSSALCIAE